ncbi:hypothetical protein AAVH_17608, partial [Aphelenchoides avenae]
MLSVTVIISAAFLYFCEAFDAIKSPTATALQEFSSSSRHLPRARLFSSSDPATTMPSSPKCGHSSTGTRKVIRVSANGKHVE